MTRTTPRVALAALLATTMLVACAEADGDGDGDDGASPTTTAAVESTVTTSTPGPLERYDGSTSESYADGAHWLCRPDTEDACDGVGEAAVVGTNAVESVRTTATADAAPRVDCFYVYPTISRDTTPVSDWEASPDEEGAAARQQVAWLSSQCRVFAPVYRQHTLGALASRVGGDEPTGSAEASDPYTDVLDAWRTYMADDNNGRGVVLIGHSQGAALLSRLIAEEIDPNDDVRAQLVAAYLAGWAVAVPEGADVGGAFAHVPLCRTADQAGCVVTWASFRAASPPPQDAFFGKPREGTDPAACTNPASLTGGAADADAVLPANKAVTILAPAPTVDEPWIDPSVATVEQEFVSLPGLVSVECAEADGYHYLAVTTHGDPADPRVDDIGGDLTPQWGLHLLDLGLVMGDVARLVASQTTAWEATR